MTQTDLLTKISAQIRDKATRGKASYPDEQLLAVADSIDAVLAEPVPLSSMSQPARKNIIDIMAADIRQVDGKHDLGAGALAEKLYYLGWRRSAQPSIEPPLVDIGTGM